MSRIKKFGRRINVVIYFTEQATYGLMVCCVVIVFSGWLNLLIRREIYGTLQYGGGCFTALAGAKMQIQIKDAFGMLDSTLRGLDCLS